VLLNYHIGRFVLGSLCIGDLVWMDAQWTENKTMW